jgi:hypothetical protein
MRILGHEFPGHDAGRAELRQARQHLAEVSDGLTEETDDYLEANGQVVQAEEKLPWYLH